MEERDFPIPQEGNLMGKINETNEQDGKKDKIEKPEKKDQEEQKLKSTVGNMRLKTVHYNPVAIFSRFSSEDALTLSGFLRDVPTLPIELTWTEDATEERCFPYTLKRCCKDMVHVLSHRIPFGHGPEVYNKFYTAWERSRCLLIQLPPTMLPLGAAKPDFLFDGLTQASQSMVDMRAGGAMGKKLRRKL
nr:uncharacterized protein LOC109189544 [Ipomoea batatas]